MREYKFRAWDNERKKMLSPEDLEQTDEPDETKKTIYSYLSFGVLYIYDFRSSEPVEFIPMQCIGFVDKNLKDIYEGDFVNIDGVIFEIAWSNEIAGFIVISDTGERMVTGEFLTDSSEVVGNIFTNPEWVVRSSLR